MKNAIKILFSLLVGVLAYSCQKETQPEVVEEIAVSPAEIDASSELANYKVDVTSNVKWTVSVEGPAASWITLSRTSGNGNLQVSIRVAENKYKEERAASIVFKTQGGKSATVSLIQAGNQTG